MGSAVFASSRLKIDDEEGFGKLAVSAVVLLVEADCPKAKGAFSVAVSEPAALAGEASKENSGL